jgi:hypothetical protein
MPARRSSICMPSSLSHRDSVLSWLTGSSEADTLACAIADGDQKAITAAFKSGKVQVKQRKQGPFSYGVSPFGMRERGTPCHRCRQDCMRSC